jgi:hypothetical protein
MSGYISLFHGRSGFVMLGQVIAGYMRFVQGG